MLAARTHVDRLIPGNKSGLSPNCLGSEVPVRRWQERPFGRRYACGVGRLAGSERGTFIDGANRRTTASARAIARPANLCDPIQSEVAIRPVLFRPVQHSIGRRLLAGPLTPRAQLSQCVAGRLPFRHDPIRPKPLIRPPDRKLSGGSRRDEEPLASPHPRHRRRPIRPQPQRRLPPTMTVHEHRLIRLGPRIGRNRIEHPSQHALETLPHTKAPSLTSKVTHLTRIRLQIEQLRLETDVVVIRPPVLPHEVCRRRRTYRAVTQRRPHPARSARCPRD